MRGFKFIIAVLTTALLVSCSGQDSSKENSENELGKRTYYKKGSYYRITVNDKVGFMDASGKIIIEPQFDDASYTFTEDVCYAMIGDRQGLINKEGNFIVELSDTVTNVQNFVNGFAKYNCGLRIGIINKEGRVIIPAIHRDVILNIDADNLYFCVVGSSDGDSDWFMADKYGNTIGPRCDSINYGFKNGLCPVKIKEKWGYMNTLGEIAIQPQYDYAETFADNDLASVKKEGNYLFIDKAGNQVLKYDHIFNGFSKNRASVLIDGKKCLINNHGEIICNINADKTYPFRDDNYALTIKDNKASLIDTLGNIVLTTEYGFIGTFNNGIAEVKNENKFGCGFIDITGKEIIPFEYHTFNHSIIDDNVSPIRGVCAIDLTEDNLQFCNIYYDLKGNMIWQDILPSIKNIPDEPERDDFVEYFDSRLGELDPIEGIYYVTFKTYYQDRDNLSYIGLNDTKSQFYAIAKSEDENTFMAHCVDGTNRAWVNKFVKIGDTNNYAIMKIDEDNDYSSEGRVAVDSPAEFNFRLEQGHNNWYNFFVTYEFVRDYPPMSEYEKILKVEWTGSGFAIADGYIVTNYHVTSGANTILVRGVNGNMNNRFKGYVIASDKEHDISIIKIVDKDFESLGKIPYIVGKSMIDVGDSIFVLGYPMTDTMGEEVKLTDGIISAGSGYKGDVSMYQISAAVQPGNSGGPVFNSEGNVVGIVCGKHSSAENANYAIKTSYLYSLINSANVGIIPARENRIKDKELSKKVEQLKNYVYIIECSSR